MKKSILTYALMLVSSLSFAEVVVVVHPSNTAELDRAAISKIFLGKSSSFPGGARAVPLSLKEGDAATEEFNDKVLGKSGAQLKSYWSKLVFTGKGTPPKALDTPQAMMDAVKSDPGAIGFVPAGTVTGDVRVLGSF